MNSNNIALMYLQRLKKDILLLLFACCAACFLSHAATAQNASLQLAPDKNPMRPVPERFVSDLKALSQRWKAAVIAEGQPVTADPTGPLSLPVTLSQEEAVKTLAKYYDYAVARQGRVFVLTKLYTDPDDLPEVTLEECFLALKAVAQMFAPLNPKFPPSNRFGSPKTHIVHLLTPQQLEALSQNGLPMASLSAAQREEVWRMALSVYLQQQADAVEHATGGLEKIIGQDVLFHRQDIADVNAFGYDLNTGDPPKRMFQPLNHSNKILATVDGGIATVSRTTPEGEPAKDIDPTDPSVKQTEQAQWSVLPVAVTLAYTASALNARTGATVRCSVETALAAKRVTTAGLEERTPAEVMQALALLYGLRVLHKEDGSLFLARPKDPYARDIADLGRAARSAIPPPLFHALHARIEADRQAQNPSFVSLVQPTPRPLDQGEYTSAGGALRLAAVQQLRALAEPKVEASRNKSLPLSKIGEQEKKWFAVYQAIVNLADTCYFGDSSLPPYLADFDHVLLTGNLSSNEQGHPCFSLSFFCPDPITGEMRRRLGMMNYPVIQQ